MRFTGSLLSLATLAVTFDRGNAQSRQWWMDRQEEGENGDAGDAGNWVEQLSEVFTGGTMGTIIAELGENLGDVAEEWNENLGEAVTNWGENLGDTNWGEIGSNLGEAVTGVVTEVGNHLQGHGWGAEKNFNKWCAHSWSQKRACTAAEQVVEAAAGEVQAVHDGEQPVRKVKQLSQVVEDIPAAVEGYRVMVVSEDDGSMIADGLNTGMANVAEEDPALFEALQKGGIQYLLETDRKTGQVLSERLVVTKWIPIYGNEESEDAEIWPETTPERRLNAGRLSWTWSSGNGGSAWVWAREYVMVATTIDIVEA